MAAPYVVRVLVLSSGERLPVLLGVAEGLPLHEPMLYTMVRLRTANASTSTIEFSLRAILVLQLFLEHRSINLEQRFLHGRALSEAEIDALARACRWPMNVLYEQFTVGEKPLHAQRIHSLERFRARLSKAPFSEVVPDMAANRLRCIRQYLDWLIQAKLGSLEPQGHLYRALESQLQFLKGALKSREPVGRGRNAIGRREGAAPEDIDKLLSLIKPKALGNPWRNTHVQVRNALMVHWLLHLGVRRGELLNVKVADIDFRLETVTIVRRADDPQDPRANQPRVKTLDRVLPLSSSLAAATYDYVIHWRSKPPGAHAHEFLFVAEYTGHPLSLVALNKTFQVLRNKCILLPSSLTPHVLRHTFNDRLSEIMDEKGISEEREKQIRCQLNGWKETSGTAATYTRRHIRKKAAEASLSMQERMLSTGGGWEDAEP
ncbi:site-specific integrase [Pseudomonas cavernicola]|uniref:Site-specific integrase n=1 Tax=Pseudomonas cavernicola TaxID=2320866 RepID=A0A418XIC7_9PSED|nr:site-specific integrase [Pseudomonas cavernicola]RJG12191.1 site-specific integrase [Pseudomonas cavernicola]